MKKLIAISVMLVLLTGAVFAQPSIGGNLQFNATVISNNAAGDLVMGPTVVADDNAHLNINIGDSSSGGMFRVMASGVSQYWMSGGPGPGSGIFGFMWWQPSDLFRIQIGRNPDGNWGADRYSGWGFTAEAKNSGAMNAYSNKGDDTFFVESEAGNSFYGGINAMGINMSFYFGEMFTLNLGIPFHGATEPKVQLSDLTINAVINIDGIGVATLAYTGGGAGFDGDSSFGDIYASFFLSAIDGMGVDLGLALHLPDKGDDMGIRVGVGFQYTGDGFNVKARLGVVLGDAMKFSINVLPSMTFGNITAFFYAGFGMTTGDNSVMGFFINPYMKMPAGNLNLYAGFKLYNADLDNGDMNYALMFGFQQYF